MLLSAKCERARCPYHKRLWRSPFHGTPRDFTALILVGCQILCLSYWNHTAREAGWYPRQN